jgi:hypothetical protein
MTLATAKQSQRSGRANKGSKPGEHRGGRPKGAPNKLTGDVKAMILAALDKAGGAEYLLGQSRDNPTAFMTLVGKVLPMQLTGADGGAIQITEVKLTIIDPTNA